MGARASDACSAWRSRRADRIVPRFSGLRLGLLSEKRIGMSDESSAPSNGKRSGYLDNIRVFLTALVVLHHFAITYGAPGWWFYIEQPVDGLTGAILFPFVAINQAYFMGFFFLLSAYLLPGSLKRKGRRRFVADRLLRLGVPLVVYFLVLNPLVFAISSLASPEAEEVFQTTLANDPGALLGTGPMWFVAFLLLLTLVYLALPDRSGAATGRSPIRLTVANTTIFALGLGLASFAIRIVAPIGTWVAYLVEPAHAPQYVGLFCLGIVFGTRGWDEEVPRTVWRYWACMLPVSLLVGFGFLGLILGDDGDPARAMGGLDAASFVYALWEHLCCIGIIVLLVRLFRRRLAGPGPRLQSAALDSYATYIVHPLVIVGLAVGLQSVALYPLVKFLIFAPIAVLASFAVGHLMRSLPGARRVL